jgi:hypothetical protein
MFRVIHDRLPAILICCFGIACLGPAPKATGQAAQTNTRFAHAANITNQRSKEYAQVQQRLARGWNTWDVDSVMTQVLLPDGLAIHTGLKHNSTEGSDSFLPNALIGRLTPGAERVIPGPHTWDGSYTDMGLTWDGDALRIQTAHDGHDLVLLATPLRGTSKSAVPPTIVFSIDFLWNRPGTAIRQEDFIESRDSSGPTPIYCTCSPAGSEPGSEMIDVPSGGPHFSADLAGPVGISTGRRRTLVEVEAAIKEQQQAYEQSLGTGPNAPIVDAIETTLGWDTIYEPSHERVISPVSRVWSVQWGGYVIFDWDTFFAATMASISDRDLAYANAMETLREQTSEGFVPNYARAGGWKSFDRSEPPVGAITVLGLYETFHDRWFLEDAFVPLLQWNRWWALHRTMDGYLVWGSNGENPPRNLDDKSQGTRLGAILESGLDNSPMYDNATYNPHTHVLEYADVGLMSMYIADCDALGKIAEILNQPDISREVKERSAHFRIKLATLWNPKEGIFLNKDLHTGQFNMRLSPTNFYPLLARTATAEQARTMIEKHLLNPKEFWGTLVIPSIERDDPAFKDQNYWRGRIWGPMNYLVYLGLRNYDDSQVQHEFAERSYALFLKEWTQNGHVHENYNAIMGTGDDVRNSDRFYHWGALLGYIEYLEQNKDPH